MPRFADIARGTRATRTISFPFVGDAVADVALRPLNGLEIGSAHAAARAYALAEYAKAKPEGDKSPAPEPREGDRLFDLGYMVATLHRACLDPIDTVTPFFASTAEILDGLDGDRIVLLYEQQQSWQEQCSPGPRNMTGPEHMGSLIALAAEEDGAPQSFFDRWRPSFRRSWARSTARLYLNSLTLKSPSSSTTASADST